MFCALTIFYRNGFLEKNNQHGVGVMQEIASGVLKQLGRGTINWQDLTPWEADFMKMLIVEVEGVPGREMRRGFLGVPSVGSTGLVYT